MPPTPPPIQTSPSATNIALTIVMWLAWIGVILIADFMAFMMLAFADSPGSANAAKLMIVPMFIWFAVTLAGGIVLLIFRGPWQIPLAFILAMSPPFLMFAGYNLLSGAGKPSGINTSNVQPAPPPVNRIGQTSFVPAPTTVPVQPDFQKMIREVGEQTKQDATTQPKVDR